MGTNVSETHYRHISDLRHTDDDESLCSFLVMLVEDDFDPDYDSYELDIGECVVR